VSAAAAVKASPAEQKAFERALAGSEGAHATPLPGYPVSDIWAEHRPSAYLVKRLLGPGELTVLVGQSGHLKSVLAVDLALCVGSGNAFHGHRVRQGGVLYVAGEGHAGIRKRVRAWAIAHALHSESPQPLVYITAASADLVGNPEQLSATVKAAAAALGAEIELVVIDTLAANFGLGDENQAAYMTLAIQGARQAAPRAAVLMVHHTGHGQVERERGSYALVAAADYRVLATYDEAAKLLEVKWLKCKDDEKPEPIVFARKVLPLEWMDSDGEELTSVVLELADADVAFSVQPPRERTAGMGANQETILKVLKRMLRTQRQNVKEQGRDPAEARVLVNALRTAVVSEGRMVRQRFSEAMEGLRERGLLVLDGHFVYPKEGGES